jgi:hypothetical protein
MAVLSAGDRRTARLDAVECNEPERSEMKTTHSQTHPRGPSANNAAAKATYWIAGLLLSGIAALVAGERSGLAWLTGIGCCLTLAAPAAMLLEFHRSGMIVSNRGGRWQPTFRRMNPLRFRMGMTLLWLVWGGTLLAVVLHGLGYI